MLDHLFYTNIIKIFVAAYLVNNLKTDLEGGQGLSKIEVNFQQFSKLLISACLKVIIAMEYYAKVIFLVFFNKFLC